MIHKHILSCAVVCVIAVTLAATTPQAAWACGGGVICVDTNASGAATGLSWTDAFTNVQDALTAASYGDEIWVAGGAYYPDEGLGQTNNDQTATFALKPGVALLGGFAGTKSTTIDLRDPEVYVTVLSGDIDGNDIIDAHGVITGTTSITGSNVYHVVTSANVSETARLDGFTITGGYGFDSETYPEKGGGMCNTHSSPTLMNLIFSGNLSIYGGGMANEQSAPILTNVLFTGNSASSGGGMYNFQSNPELNDVTFDYNLAAFGGGMINGTSNPILRHVIFTKNVTILGSGAGMFSHESNPVLIDVSFIGNRSYASGGGMYNFQSNPEIINSAFIGNKADMYGGGLLNDGTSNATLTNVTISGNLSDMYGGGLVNAYTGSLTLTNCILWGNHAITGTDIHLHEGGHAITATYSDIRWPGGVFTGTGNININPRFFTPITATAAPTAAGDYRLGPSSPAIDAGNSLNVTMATDLDGSPRIVGDAVDMGAYEAPVFVLDDQTFLPLVLRN